MEQQPAHDKDRIWAAWMRAPNPGDGIAYRRLLEAPVVGVGNPVNQVNPVLPCQIPPELSGKPFDSQPK
jgi:hypothetical protein